MAMQWRNDRLALCVAISLLAHVLVFFLFGLLLRLDTSIAKQKIAGNLDVRLSLTPPSKSRPMPGNKLLASPAPARLKIAQPDIISPPDIAPQPSTQPVEQAPSQSKTGGIAFPGAVATPFPAKTSSSNPFFQSRSPRQDIARTYHQQSMEAQASEQSAQRTQAVIQQMLLLLYRRLDVQPVVTGKCMLAGQGPDTNGLLACDSPALYEVISKDEKAVAAMLAALREMGSLLSGFSAEIRAGQLTIILVER